MRKWFSFASASLMVMLLCAQSLESAEQLKLDITPVHSVLKADEKQTTWVRVGLEGFALESEKQRPPANVAIVLDKSGSMQGEKISQAINGAVDAIRMLGPNDIVSVVTYDSTVNVLVPATKLTDPEAVIAQLKTISAGGNTALFAGVSKGAAEVRKFLDKERVNRVILLSDGLANVGPSSPGELGDLGTTLMKENISVSTLGLGLGYNEDLMVQIASKSGGNHLFVENATELADVFRREFNDVLSVVAQGVELKIEIPTAIRPIRVLGNDADIAGQEVRTRLAQVYSRQNKHIVIEVELPASEELSKLSLGSVVATYTNMKSNLEDRLTGAVEVEFSSDPMKVEQSLNKSVLADVVALVSSDQNKLATQYLDSGDIVSCRQVLKSNEDFLAANAALCPTDGRLQQLQVANREQQAWLKDVSTNSDPSANIYRKSQRALSSQLDSQQLNVDSSGSPDNPSKP